MSILPPPWGDDAATADSALFSSILVSRGIPTLLLLFRPPKQAQERREEEGGILTPFLSLFHDDPGGREERGKEKS